MLYMILCSFLLIMAMYEMFSTMAAIGGDRFTGSRFGVLALIMLTLALISPFLVTFYTLGRPASLDTLTSLSVGAQWTGAAAATFLTVQYGLRAWKNRHFWYTGAAIASALITLIYSDSLLFVSQENTGTVSTFVLGDNGSNDVECQRAALLVHYTRGTPTEWRCPTSIMFMSETSRPFVPWPDYSQGRSQYLTTMIDVLTDRVEQIERSHVR
ncbi:TPA: hypothetical protein ACWSSN_003276 [Escherichia coli]